MAPRIGFIGLGTMGAGMARNLAKAGLPLTVATHSPGKAQAFARELGGAVEARDTPEEVARRSEIVVSCLPDSPEVEEVHLGPKGTIRGAAPQTVVVDCSTIDPDAARAIGNKLATSGIAFLDAPVSGGQKGAAEGTLTFFVGGEAGALERARPALAAMGKRVTHLGSSGAGQLGKAVNQILVAGTLVAVSEGISFAEKSGLPLPALHEALMGGAASSWMLDVLGKKMIARDFAPAFAIKHQQKDLAILLKAARAIGAPLPGAALAHQLLSALEAQGRGEDGTQALLTLYERMVQPA
jgi:3-hydroxyisobutyrate dehydrogenase-like beta-hydroxyacid dehydrogenase